MEKIDRPSVVEDGHLQFLDDLRSTNTKNMFSAARDLILEFGISRTDAEIVLQYWMESYSERHPE